MPGLWFNGFRPEFQGYFYSAAKGAQRIGNGILSEAETLVRDQPSRQAKLVA
ncbi:hypothetical protein [Ruegeria sp. ANG-S4]|uniref:hypothetical protein n=1 Tax=Ruegeria sp. ANG-S4 TaxID=1577904 RepID=UPI000A6FC23A|nr:hypothetical protein [Ruegeria sp. ANG-S4]